MPAFATTTSRRPSAATPRSTAACSAVHVPRVGLKADDPASKLLDGSNGLGEVVFDAPS